MLDVLLNFHLPHCYRDFKKWTAPNSCIQFFRKSYIIKAELWCDDHLVTSEGSKSFISVSCCVAFFWTFVYDLTSELVSRVCWHMGLKHEYDQRRRKLLKSGPARILILPVGVGWGLGRGHSPLPNLKIFLIFSNTTSQFSQHKIVKIRL